MEIFLLVWVAFAIGMGMAANSRGRSFFGFALLSFFFSPILALIVLALLPDLIHQARIESQRDDDRRRDDERQLAALRATAKSASTLSVADELEKLTALKERGLLTTAEFDAQRRQLLSG